MLQDTLIIFDCDGVLVDSEQISAIACSEYLCRFGIELSPSECIRKFRGKRFADLVFTLNSQYSDYIKEKEIHQLEAYIAASLNEKLLPIPGVENVIEFLCKNNVPFCVASSGSYKKTQGSLNRVGFLKFFSDRIYSSEGLKLGKPAPDIFLHAAKKMGINCQHSVVIEDSYYGVLAAVRSGAQTINYVGDFPDIRISTIDAEIYTADTMSDVLEYILNINELVM